MVLKATPGASPEPQFAKMRFPLGRYIDALPVQRGKSLVIAPSQTVTDDDLHRLRALSLAVVKALGVVRQQLDDTVQSV